MLISANESTCTCIFDAWCNLKCSSALNYKTCTNMNILVVLWHILVVIISNTYKCSVIIIGCFRVKSMSFFCQHGGWFGQFSYAL